MSEDLQARSDDGTVDGLARLQGYLAHKKPPHPSTGDLQAGSVAAVRRRIVMNVSIEVPLVVTGVPAGRQQRRRR